TSAHRPRDAARRRQRRSRGRAARQARRRGRPRRRDVRRMGCRAAVTGFVDAVTFLTRIPLRTHEHDDTTVARAVPWFPVVGAGVGLVVAGVYAGTVFLL